MESPGSGWKSARPDQDDVFINETDALAAIDLESKCSNHGKQFFCLTCLPKIEKALRTARQILDPIADPVIENSTSSVPYPDVVALVNELVQGGEKKSLALGSSLSRKAIFKKSILTSLDLTRSIDRILLAHHTTKSFVCDIVFMRAFSVRLGDKTPAEAAKKLWDCPFVFQINGVKLVEVKFREILQHPKIILKRLEPGKTDLFSAVGMTEDGTADAIDWRGYFLPNGTVIEAWLENVPSGGGLIQLHTEWDYADYTTRGFAKT